MGILRVKTIAYLLRGPGYLDIGVFGTKHLSNNNAWHPVV